VCAWNNGSDLDYYDSAGFQISLRLTGSTKSEVRNPKQTQKSKQQCPKLNQPSADFGHLDFVIRDCFEFRNSCFEFEAALSY